MRITILAAVLASMIFGECGNAKLHKAMEQNNSMVFMYKSVNTKLQSWPKGKTTKEKAKAIEELLKEVKEKRRKLKDMKVVKELVPVKEELDRYFATVEEGYTKILESYKKDKEGEVAAKVNELNAKLKEIAENLIALQEKAAKELGVKINREMIRKKPQDTKPLKEENKSESNKESMKAGS